MKNSSNNNNNKMMMMMMMIGTSLGSTLWDKVMQNEPLVTQECMAQTGVLYLAYQFPGSSA